MCRSASRRTVRGCLRAASLRRLPLNQSIAMLTSLNLKLSYVRTIHKDIECRTTPILDSPRHTFASSTRQWPGALILRQSNPMRLKANHFNTAFKWYPVPVECSSRTLIRRCVAALMGELSDESSKSVRCDTVGHSGGRRYDVCSGSLAISRLDQQICRASQRCRTGHRRGGAGGRCRDAERASQRRFRHSVRSEPERAPHPVRGCRTRQHPANRDGDRHTATCGDGRSRITTFRTGVQALRRFQ